MFRPFVLLFVLSFAFAFAFASALSLPAVGTTLSNCNTSSLLTPVAMNASPAVPKYQETVTLTIQLSEPLTVATVATMESWFNGWLSYSASWPIDDGIPVVWTNSFDWPTRVPGYFRTRIRLTTADQTHLCILHETTIPWL